MPRDVVQNPSPREDEILRLAADGLTDTAIAHELGISEGTVGTYWGRIRTKIGPYPRTEIIAVKIRDELERKIQAEIETRHHIEADLHAAVDDDALYHEIVDSAVEGILVVNPAGVIVHANPAAHRILRYETGTLVKRRLADLVPEPARARHLSRFSAYGGHAPLSEKLTNVETTAVDALGGMVPISINVSSLQIGDSHMLVGFFTERRQISRDGHVSVEDLKSLGVRDAAALDLDGNGVIDANELSAALAKNRPA